MKEIRCKNKSLKIFLFVLAIFSIVLSLSVFAANENNQDEKKMFFSQKVSLTEEEQQYLKENPTLIMAADSSWRPLEYLNNEQYSGVISKITQKIEDYTGLNIEYDVMGSYEEALETVQNGKADMVSGLANDENMADEYNVILSEPFLKINSAIVTNKELSKIYNGVEHKKIAVVEGDYVNDDIKNEILNSELIECSSNEECLEKVKQKEADMAIIASYCAEYYLSIPKYSEFHNHILSDFNWDLAFGINKNTNPLLISILNKGIKAIPEVEKNDLIYQGVSDAEYDNDLMSFIYKHPLLIIALALAILLLIVFCALLIYISKKKEHMRMLQDGARLKLALQRTSLCIWEYDIASKSIVKIDNEKEKHGFNELRNNIPESVIEKGYIHPDDIKLVKDVFERALSGENDVEGCWRVKDKDSENANYWWEQILFHTIVDEHKKPVTIIGVSEDVTKEQDAQKDSLTSVYNRNSFEEKAKYVLNERRNSYLLCAFLILDLDGFKQINDTYGHGTGDKVLIAVGNVLSKTFRSTDIVGRLGGDEFTVFMTSIRERKDAERKANELIENVRNIAKTEGFPFAVSCSVGIEIEEKGKETITGMYKKADLALYEAKNSGKNRYKVYNAETKKKILVVDDLEMNRVILKKSLEAEYDVLEAENGEEAWQILNESGDIDMVITDVVMPKMDGTELIKKIRNDDSLSNIAVIVITQYGDIKQEKEIFALGVDDFVYKAASLEVIQLRVSNVMRMKNG